MKQSLKNAAKGLINNTVLPFLNYVAQGVPTTTVLGEPERRTAAECADYVQARMPAATQLSRKKDLLDHAITRVGPDGLIAEFGVWNVRVGQDRAKVNLIRAIRN